VSARREEPAASTAAAPAPVVESRRRPRDSMSSLRQACRQIFGIPDYDRYLAHMAEHHPGESVLSRREFFVRSIDRKYGKSGPRCC
jgi:uncharacterized short protein YbdD (DUF466 family)